MDDDFDDFNLDGSGYTQHEESCRRADLCHKEAFYQSLRGQTIREATCHTCQFFFGHHTHGFCSNSDEPTFTHGSGWCPNYETRAGVCIIFSEWAGEQQEEQRPPKRKREKKDGRVKGSGRVQKEKRSKKGGDTARKPRKRDDPAKK